ncbi:phytoene synthase [Motilibacter peucedani]|uniref:Phytoene synthase n=1 Tax=Motilibacter peucedani TaxID=598650 RepID=A0A420XKM0_9ACTN|nr:presqualene diphosphate synthase HpnD [Motilibacter peucedani]RKS67987.1 phytoene synthase [Motilibacter peucedani]
MSTTTVSAYSVCTSITREQARNFYYGIRLLPPVKRDALCALYALARRIDDIGDGELAQAEKVAGLAALRAEIEHLHASSDPVLCAVADAARRYPVPVEAFLELVDGVEMDVVGHHYADLDDLVGYCRRVAGTVGRLCLGVFGSRPDPDAESYADNLGIALQLTNILRDVREDLLNGRVYVPQSDLDAFGVQLELDERGTLVDVDGGLTRLVHHSAARARDWYADGLRLVPLLDRRSAACCAAMAGIYRRLLERIDEQPSAVFGARLSLTGREKAVVAARALTGLGA